MAWEVSQRRLFDNRSKGQLVEDTVLLRIESELPAGLPTALELLHWGAQERSPQEHAQYSALAALCKERLMTHGRGAIVTEANGKVKVQLLDGTSCEVFPSSAPTADGAVAILKMPPGSVDIVEIRYRTDHSVEVRGPGVGASGISTVSSPRTVRRPRSQDWLRETGGWHLEVPGPLK